MKMAMSRMGFIVIDELGLMRGWLADIEIRMAIGDAGLCHVIAAEAAAELKHMTFRRGRGLRLEIACGGQLQAFGEFDRPIESANEQGDAW